MLSRFLLTRGSLQPLPLEGGPGSGFNSTLCVVLRSIAIVSPSLEARFDLGDGHIGQIADLDLSNRDTSAVFLGVSGEREHSCVAHLGDCKTELHIVNAL